MTPIAVAMTIVLAQATGQAAPPRLPQAITLRSGATIYGFVEPGDRAGHMVHVTRDEPWSSSPPSDNYWTGKATYQELSRVSDDRIIASQRQESLRDYEARIKAGFRKAGFHLVGTRYWLPQDWVPKVEYDFAERSRKMVEKVEAQLKPAVLRTVVAPINSAKKSKAAAEAPSHPGLFAHRGPEALLAVGALVLMGIVAKIFLF